MWYIHARMGASEDTLTFAERSAERVDPGNFLNSPEISDGLGPMQRWERDREDPVTVTVIVQRVAEGERLKQICRSRGWPYALVAQWVSESEEVAKAYEQALRLAADDLAMETVGIADAAQPEDVAVAKHRTDIRLKLASRLHRERYGEQVQHNVTIDPFGEMLKRVSDRKLKALRAEQTQGEVIEGQCVTLPATEPVCTDEEI